MLYIHLLVFLLTAHNRGQQKNRIPDFIFLVTSVRDRQLAWKLLTLSHMLCPMILGNAAEEKLLKVSVQQQMDRHNQE